MTARRSQWTTVLFGLLVLAGGLALVVHVARPSSGTMFDDDNFGSTVIEGGLGLIVAVIAVVMTRSLLRAVVLEAACPRCGAVALRQFENPRDPASWPTACGSCIAYLRANGDQTREEALDAASWLFYKLAADQYLPAVTRTERGDFTFEMPAMCASCGAPNARHHRKIADGDHFGRDIGPLWSQSGHVLPQAGMTPSAPDEASRGLTNLSAPVCAKHTEAEDPSTDVIKYSSGTLAFRSYRYYKAFCELNKIERAPIKRS